MKWQLVLALGFVLSSSASAGDQPPGRMSDNPPVIRSSWDDLLEGFKTRDDWRKHREVLKRRYLELIHDAHKPKKPPPELKVHESVVVDGAYTRRLVSYNVESDERAAAYVGVPLSLKGKAPGIVSLHSTSANKSCAAGLVKSGDVPWLDILCRRGYVVISPDHFVCGDRKPPEGQCDTTRFYKKHPEWTAVGKFTYEHSIAVDVLETLDEVDTKNIGVLGYSLGGHGAYYLAAYDQRLKACACNCGWSSFRHNPNVITWARDHWYVYFKYLRPALLEGKLPPIDMHEIIALIAPRAFLDLSGLNDGNPLVQRQRVLMLTRLMDVWELEGVPANFAFYIHGRGHSAAHVSRQLIYAWMDTHLKPPEATKTHLVNEK